MHDMIELSKIQSDDGVCCLSAYVICYMHVCMRVFYLSLGKAIHLRDIQHIDVCVCVFVL